MTIQFNTDKNISGGEKFRAPFIALISEELSRFSNQITRVVVHMSDENSVKGGVKDKRCMIEARLKGRKPIAVTNQANSVDQAVNGAVDKLKKSLTRIVERMRNN